jgi:hypothetical protein
MRRRLRLLSGVLAACCALAASAGAEDLDLRRVCDTYTALTLIGVDTSDDVALFAMSSKQEEVPGWIVELRPMDGVARLYPDWRDPRRFGGSIAPGPVLVFGRCGNDCLQVMSWRDGGWREVGAPLTAASSATAYPTRDGDGVPWVVLHRPTDESGVVLAEAYRLSGGQWSAQGRLPVAAVGSPAVALDCPLASAASWCRCQMAKSPIWRATVACTFPRMAAPCGGRMSGCPGVETHRRRPRSRPGRSIYPLQSGTRRCRWPGSTTAVPIFPSST